MARLTWKKDDSHEEEEQQLRKSGWKCTFFALRSNSNKKMKIASINWIDWLFFFVCVLQSSIICSTSPCHDSNQTNWTGNNDGNLVDSMKCARAQFEMKIRVAHRLLEFKFWIQFFFPFLLNNRQGNPFPPNVKDEKKKKEKWAKLSRRRARIIKIYRHFFQGTAVEHNKTKDSV